MKKFIKIGMILVVLLSMVGYASASSPVIQDEMTVDIPTNGESYYEISYVPSDITTTTATFILKEFDGTNWVPTNEVVGNLDGGPWESASSTSVLTSNVVGNVAYWTIGVKDNDVTPDEDDADQINKIYKVIIYCDTDESDPMSLTGTAEGYVTGIPEFPTIALPVAAILGLAFIIQRRREED